MKNLLKISSICVLAASTFGCTMINSMEERSLINNSVSVGGGYYVEYIAPVDGTAYYYDKTSQRILTTKTMQKDESFTFKASDYQAELGSVLGKYTKDARLLLYFKPDYAQKAASYSTAGSKRY